MLYVSFPAVQNNMSGNIFILIFFLFLISCNNETGNKEITPLSQNPPAHAPEQNKVSSKQHRKADSLEDSLLASAQLHPTIKYYIRDSNVMVLQEQLKDPILFKNLGDINSDGIPDSVFLMPEFFYSDSGQNEIDFGQSFTFTSVALSRIQTAVTCNQLDNLFVIGDIDEDGIKEIGLYTTSCASRYKALRVYSFKHNQWKQEGIATFDIMYSKPEKEKRIKKISKGEFAIREVTDLNGAFHDKWIKFEIN